MRKVTIQSKAAKGLLGWILCTKSINVWEDIREFGFFCILKHISRVCGPTHAMPTCMNFFYRITDLHSFSLMLLINVVLLIWTKYAVPCQLKPGILKLTITRGQSNFNIVYILVDWEENECYCVQSVNSQSPGSVVSDGQQRFDCRSYCVRSRRKQGYKLGISWNVYIFNPIDIKTRPSPLTFLSHIVQGRVPFDQKFRYEFPKFSYVEWNGVSTRPDRSRSIPAWARFPPRITRQNAEGSWWSGWLKCCKLLHVEKFNTHSEFNSSLIFMRETYELFSREIMQTGRTDPQEIRNDQSTIFQEIRS